MAPSAPAPSLRLAFRQVVQRRLGDDAPPPEGALDDVLDFVAGRGPGPFTVRARPTGTILLDGSPAPGPVVELTGDDRPLIVTSVDEEVRSHGLRTARMIPLTFGATRQGGQLTAIGGTRRADHVEAILQLALARPVEETALAGLLADLDRVLDQLVLVTDDHEPMRTRLVEAAAALDPGPGADEARDTVAWLLDGNALLLGLAHRPSTGPDGIPPDLGLYRAEGSWAEPTDLDDGLGPDRPLRLSRLAALSPLHRQVPLLQLDLWQPGEAGRAERLLWVVTRRAASAPLTGLPLVRRKLEELLAREDVAPGSYDEQLFTLLFQSLPDDDIVSLGVDDLAALLRELRIEDRDHSVQVVLRSIPDVHAVAALVSLPMERWSRALRERLERFLLAQLDGRRVDVSLSMGGVTSTATARVLVHVAEDQPLPDRLDALTREVRVLCRSWEEQVSASVAERGPRPGQETGQPVAADIRRIIGHLPPAYVEVTAPGNAVTDVLALEAAEGHEDRPWAWFSPGSQADGQRLGLVARHPVEPSRLLPILESLGLWVTDEVRWEVGEVSLHHVHVRARDGGTGPSTDTSTGLRLAGTARGHRAAAAVTALLDGRAEADQLNRLVLDTDLTWDDVAVLRAYRRYRHQVDGRHDQAYVDEVIVGHPEVATRLVELWRARIDPHPSAERTERAAAAAAAAHRACDALDRLDHDQILRGIVHALQATVRTNHHLRPDGPLALKIDPSAMPDAPGPRPFREVFVTGPSVEGIHLRAGPVARGGLRASDRPQDYRAEVLDLVHTQVLKNAIIAPTGAKGGFVVRGRPGVAGPPTPDDVAAAYDAFVTALLDVTDDRRGDDVIPVPGRWDGDDPYLVVAADKGTARFSDRANALARARGYWLDDAFASGGSHGYDHKALGITARGAWVAITTHLRRLGLDPRRDEITVAGVGDMSGDVFGNGLLHSDRLRLVAAFDHRHVFLDPDPDPATSHAERQRLFDLPRSSWADYDPGLLSPGGGVHDRRAKAVPVSPEVRARLGLGPDVEDLTPAELIRALLCAPVDLLYFGGIGTYVRGSEEDDAGLDDRANVEVRVTGRDLRARVVGEGANLAMTQRARVEAARRGARLNLDAIDNAAGVHSSDLEVNLKILLRQAEVEGRIDRSERDALLATHTDDVVATVLASCADQSEALDRVEAAAPGEMGAVVAVLRRLVDHEILDPDLDALPDADALATRTEAGAGLTRPELAVMLAGAKRHVAAALLASDVPDRPVTRDALVASFPSALSARFDDLLDSHPLRRELVASRVANDLVDHLGFPAIEALANETGAGHDEIALAYWVARGIIRAPDRWAELLRAQVALPPPLDDDPGDATAVLTDVLRSLTRSELVRWQRSRRQDAPWDPARRIAEDGAVADALAAGLAGDHFPRADGLRTLALRLVAGGMDPDAARGAAAAGELAQVPDVAAVALDLDRLPDDVLAAFRAVGERLGLGDLRRRVRAIPPTSRWTAPARQGLLEDLDDLRRVVSHQALAASPQAEPEAAVDHHLTGRELPGEVGALRRGPAGEAPADLDALSVAVRALRRSVL